MKKTRIEKLIRLFHSIGPSNIFARQIHLSLTGAQKLYCNHGSIRRKEALNGFCETVILIIMKPEKCLVKFFLEKGEIAYHYEFLTSDSHSPERDLYITRLPHNVLYTGTFQPASVTKSANRLYVLQKIARGEIIFNCKKDEDMALINHCVKQI